MEININSVARVIFSNGAVEQYIESKRESEEIESLNYRNCEINTYFMGKGDEDDF